MEILGFLYGLLLVYVISIILFLILDNRDPEKTLTWIIIFALFPIVGLVFYFYLGQNWKKHHFIKNFHAHSFHKQFEKLQKNNASVPLQTDLQQKVSTFIKNSSGFPLTHHNQVTHFDSAEKKYNTLFKDLANAQSFVHIQYYEFRYDKVGRELVTQLCLAAKRGVNVRFLLDFMGARHLPGSARKKLKKSRVTFEKFFDPVSSHSHHKLNYRNHRKIAIIDGTIGYVGGMNCSAYLIDGGKAHQGWRDYHLRIKGEVARHLDLVFLHDWYLNTRENLLGKDKPVPIQKSEKKQALQLMYSGPETSAQTIRQVFLLFVTNAKKSIRITTPYFVPDQSNILALKGAALSGVNVEIYLPGKPEKGIGRFAHYAARTYFEELLKAGVKIYEFNTGFLHSKVLTVDNEIASVGSANYDIRSLEVNFEANVLCYAKDDIAKVDTYINGVQKDSQQVSLKRFSKRPLSQKICQSLARLFSPLL